MWYGEYNEKNLNAKAEQTTIGSGKRFAWLCQRCKKIFFKSPNDLSANLRNGAEPCQFCSGRKAKYQNSLLAFIKLYSLEERYNFEENFQEGIRVCVLPIKSNREVYVICKIHNYETKQKVADFTSGHEFCRYCSGKIPTFENSIASRPDIIVDIDDFKTRHPEFIEKYGDFVPSKIHLNSSMIALFKCDICNGYHEKSFAERVSQKYGCDKYNAIYQTSLPEQILYLAVKEVIPDVITKKSIQIVGKNKRRKFHFDIYSSNHNLAIEYDGGWHNNEESKVRDETKNLYCVENNINLIRVRESRTIGINNYNFPLVSCTYHPSYNYMNKVIGQVYQILLERFRLEITFNNKIELAKLIINAEKSMVRLKRETSFANNYPGLLQLVARDDRKKANSINQNSSAKLNCQCINPICKDKFARSPKALIKSKGKCKKCLMLIRDISEVNSPITRWYRKVPLDRSLARKDSAVARFYSTKNELTVDEIGVGSSYVALFNCPYPDCLTEYKAKVKVQVRNGCKCKKCKREAVKYYV
ncbi:Probable Zinc-ribbon domain-containing protein [Desulfosporosinus hippei DSM 8344]|uniref:Probable Zinc-ribbon domain-containing protein n=2 Tax=Desulfosporosinus TaxID=79206 RepID=A0A1G8CGP9_9FIRM|nr:Probable Zinc-ribbon domain-containing protein [Desulfosporosinus hippei DSM 8344]